MKSIALLALPALLTVVCVTVAATNSTSGGHPLPPVSAATSQSAATRPANTETAADLLIKQLLMEKPSRPIMGEVPSEQPPVDTQPAAAPPELASPIPLPPGSIIADRLGRLAKDTETGAWTFHFESEKNVLREPPIRLLPNRLLEYMEEVSDSGRRAGIKFYISGEVTEYRGARFLLLRKVLVEREMGAL